MRTIFFVTYSCNQFITGAEMSHRPRKSPKEWQKIIESQQSSALSQRAYCQEKGLNPVTFSNWKRKLGMNQKDTEDMPGSWLELPLPKSAEQKDVNSSGWNIELDLGDGVCLRLSQTG